MIVMKVNYVKNLEEFCTIVNATYILLLLPDGGQYLGWRP